MIEIDIKMARCLYDEGKTEELYEIIKKYIDARDPYALYFYSTISLAEWKESDEEFDRRRIALLTESASGGVKDAMYQLACCYLYGEGVQVNQDKCRHFAELAALHGSEEAKLLLQQI